MSSGKRSAEAPYSMLLLGRHDRQGMLHGARQAPKLCCGCMQRQVLPQPGTVWDLCSGYMQAVMLEQVQDYKSSVLVGSETWLAS